MISTIKSVIRSLLVRLPIRVTTNTYYDYCTNKIIKQHLKHNSNCVDVGCHKGEVLDIMIKSSPKGRHFGFEPIPNLYDQLIKKYTHSNSTILPYALSSKEGQATFNYVTSNPAYSGLIKRSYDHDDEQDESITVNCQQLDNCIDPNIKIDLIKIDVEGAELGVLQGSKRILSNNRPLIIFEHGMGASDHYGTTPDDIFSILNSYNYQIFLLDDYLQQKTHLSKSDFEKQFHQKLNYYFVASYTATNHK